MSRRDLGEAWIAVVLAMAVVVSGCGSSDPAPDGGGPAAPKPAKAGTPRRPDMVAAVSSSKASGPVALQFAIPHRPVVGEPIDIQLAITPSGELERIVGRFQASEGLEVVAGADTGPLDRPAPGVEIAHTLTVMPKADGIFNITAVILTDSETESVARTFSIPVITGSGFTEAPPASPPNASASPPKP